MFGCSRYAPALAAAAGAVLVAAVCSVPSAGASTAEVVSTQAAPTISVAPAPTFTALAFPDRAAGWLLGQAATGPARAEIWHTGTAGATWQVQWEGAGTPLSI